jgi:hypothetical protein
MTVLIKTLIIRINQKTRIHSVCLPIQQLFIQNNISHKKTKQTHDLLLHTEGAGNCHSVSPVNACLYHRIMDFANKTTMRQLLALPHQSGTCDYQDGSSDESHLMPSQGSVVDVHDTPIQIAATCCYLSGCVGSLFCCLVRYVILDKNFLNKQIFTMYSHFLIDNTHRYILDYNLT